MVTRAVDEASGVGRSLVCWRRLMSWRAGVPWAGGAGSCRSGHLA